jgi:hypothetical protein
VRFPDGLTYDEAVAAEIAKHERLMREWNAAGTSSSVGRRTFVCECGQRRTRRRPGDRPERRTATVTQRQLNAAYRQAVAARRRRITLDDLRKVGN